MSIANFIATVWSARIQMALMKSLVFAQPGVVNRDYEGEIADKGSKVKINMISDPTIKTYTRGAAIDGPETLNDAATELEVDQAKYFNFEVDDVDKRQSQPGYFDEAMRRAAYGMKDLSDSYVAGLMKTGAANLVGSDGSPKTISSANESYSYLVDLDTALSEANVPREGRWAIVPPWFYGLLKKKQEFVLQSTPQSESRLATGIIGTASGFTIMESNNCPRTGSDYSILAGVDSAVSYAEQILKTEAYRPQDKFSDAVKGLHVYGAKVVRPEKLARLIVTRPS